MAADGRPRRLLVVRAGAPWARRIVERREYRRVVERHGPTHTVRVDREAERLSAAGLDVIATESRGRLSRYALGHRVTGTPLWVR